MRNASLEFKPVSPIDNSLDSEAGPVLIRHNARDKSRFDLFRINIVTGASELKFENTEYADLFTDSDFQLRMATRLAADGTAEIFERKPDGAWTPFIQVPIGDIDTFRLIDMGADGNTLYFLDSRERDRAALFSMDMTTRETRLLAADDEADIVEATLDEQRRPVAARANRDRSRWYAVNPTAKQDLADLARHGSGDVYFLSDSADRRKASVFLRARQRERRIRAARPRAARGAQAAGPAQGAGRSYRCARCSR